MRRQLFVGIDLGTTNTTCTVGVVAGQGRPELATLAIRQLTDHPGAPDAFEERDVLPSVVCIADDGRAYVGEYCKFLGADLEGAAVVRSIKLQMGDPAWTARSGPVALDPAEVSALILRTVRSSLERAYPDDEVARVTVTIPASFSSSMRRDTLRAADLAGFVAGRVELLDEPVAALFSAWDPDRDAFPDLPSDARALVFDMGGGTLDVSIMHVSAPDRSVRVLATSRYNEVAGNDLDLELASLVLREARAHPSYSGFLEYDANAPDGDRRRRRVGIGLMEVGEQVKHDLAERLEEEMGIRSLDRYVREYLRRGTTIRADLAAEFADEGVSPGVLDLPVAGLLECLEPLLTLNRGPEDDRNVFVPIDQAMERAGLRPGEIDHVYLAGGSSNFPPIVQALYETFHVPPKRLDASFAVSRGAVVWSLLKDRRTWTIRETLHDGLFLKRRGRPFLEVMPRPIPVPSPPRRRELSAEESPYFEAGGRAVRLEFFRGASADDPFMTLAHVERLWLPRELAPESRLAAIEGALDEAKVFHFQLDFQDARTNERVGAEVDLGPSPEPSGRGTRDGLPAGLVLNGEPV